MATKQATREAFIIRDFNDAGTNASFTAGKIEQIDVGSLANYKDAGLVRAPTADDKKSANAAAATPAA